MAQGEQGTAVSVCLTENDIPGASLAEPLIQHNNQALRYWLLCRGDKVPVGLKKADLVERVRKLKCSGANVVDVDGSYLYRKREKLIAEGFLVDPLDLPSLPLDGWKSVDQSNYKEIAAKIPCVSPGLVYSYLAEGTGNVSGSGAFRALQRGFNHWSSGRISHIEVNVENPLFVHIRCHMTPSMKPGVYHVSILLSRDNELAVVERAVCQCAAGKSASCTHVSGLLHSLVAMTSGELWLRAGRDTRDEEDSLPITSYACQWNVPKKRKDSSLPFSEGSFVKHVYGKEKKHSMKQIEGFDPRPDEYRGTATSSLSSLLTRLRGQGLSISLSLDEKSQFWKHESLEDAKLPSKEELQERVMEFKKSLHLSAEKLRDIELHTHGQSKSALWHSVRRFRLTASYFGYIKQRKQNTSPHSLVMRILNPSSFSTPATEWGNFHEQEALKLYQETQRDAGHVDLFTCPSGFVICEEYPFLGASPDSVVYDPTVDTTFGLVEVKCPYSFRNMSVKEACAQPNFFCSYDSAKNSPTLKTSHPYYSQVQGQMAITKRTWCDFVVFTQKGISIERIEFNPIFWQELLTCLVDFYDNCLAPEIVSPIHVLGLKVRNLKFMS